MQVLALAPPTPRSLQAYAATRTRRGGGAAALAMQECESALCAELGAGDTLFVPGGCHGAGCLSCTCRAQLAMQKQEVQFGAWP